MVHIVASEARLAQQTVRNVAHAVSTRAEGRYPFADRGFKGERP